MTDDWSECALRAQKCLAAVNDAAQKSRWADAEQACADLRVAATDTLLAVKRLAIQEAQRKGAIAEMTYYLQRDEDGRRSPREFIDTYLHDGCEPIASVVAQSWQEARGFLMGAA